MSKATDIEFHLVGLSHRTASVDLRERYAVQAEEVVPCVSDLVRSDEVLEAWVLSTCNRTEVLIAARPHADPAPVVTRRVFRNLASDALYHYRDVHAVMHLFRVAGGLDSVVIGETEILGQMRRALDAAAEVNGAGSHVATLVGHAIKVGKRVRKETDLGLGTLSVARVGVDVAKHVFGSFENVRTLIVGAGETGMLVARHAVDVGGRALTFVNRTFERAQNAAREIGGEAQPLDNLADAIRGADVIVACVEGTGALLRAEHFDKRGLSRRDRPLLVIDLSVPRAVDDAVRSIHNVLLHDLDDLQPVVEQNLEERLDAAAQSTPILVSEVHKFLSLRTFANFKPAITELRRRFDKTRELALDELTGGSAEAREVQLAHELTKRLLDIALTQMKESARQASSEEALDWEYQRFLKGQ